MIKIAIWIVFQFHLHHHYLNDSSNNLVQVGSDIDGETSSDNSTYSVSLSSDESVVAIGAIWNDGNGSSSAHVRIYESDCKTSPPTSAPTSSPTSYLTSYLTSSPNVSVLHIFKYFLILLCFVQSMELATIIPFILLIALLVPRMHLIHLQSLLQFQ